MTPRTSTPAPRGRAVAVGVVAVTLAAGATGVALALRPDRAAADVAVRPVTSAAPDLALDPVPGAPVDEDPYAYLEGSEEYTQERSDAFWGAGYVMEDAVALADLWQVELLEAKGRAGQLLLDGEPVPVAPMSSLDLTDPATIEMLEYSAYFEAGYTAEDGDVLAELWDVGVIEAKARAGRMVRDGERLPVEPSGMPFAGPGLQMR